MNRLEDSASLYLRQHADNPVDWWPWCDEALAEARQGGRPILLSVGYSACHWCHVMAHESFEDDATAKVMNEHYVCIKVDREERPDLDRLYQLSHQMLTGQGGGWPLTMFLAPDTLAPFYSGTYFPPTARHGLPPFTEVLRRARAWFDDNPDQVRAINQRLDAGLAATQAPTDSRGEDLPGDSAILETAVELAGRRANREQGGFGGAPKFPQAPQLAMLGSLTRITGDPWPADFQAFTLDAMARGGLRDPLDGGFFRYCVDHDWTIPHFEKMLYDNAQLLPLYAEAAQRRDDAWLRHCAEGIAQWLLTDMRGDDGAFSASIDADADGEEGGYHTWTPAQVRDVLDDAQWALAEPVFGLDGPPNFEGRAWHLARRNGLDGEGSVLATVIDRLRSAREHRVPPETDPKRLTAWNALAAEGLARAGIALGRTDWIDAAGQAMAFIRREAWDGERLFAVHAGSGPYNSGTLDDYAFTLSAALVLLEAGGPDEGLAFCRALADILIDRFADADHGGFWLTDRDTEVPIRRLKVPQDDATPSGAAVATQSLQTLGWLVADTRYLAVAGEAIDAARADMAKYALGHASFIRALARATRPPAIVTIEGDDPAGIAALQQSARRHDAVHCFVRSGTGPATARVCVGTQCLLPVSTPEALEQCLQETEQRN